jgi:hypothetical protein
LFKVSLSYLSSQFSIARERAVSILHVTILPVSRIAKILPFPWKNFEKKTLKNWRQEPLYERKFRLFFTLLVFTYTDIVF